MPGSSANQNPILSQPRKGRYPKRIKSIERCIGQNQSSIEQYQHLKERKIARQMSRTQAAVPHAQRSNHPRRHVLPYHAPRANAAALAPSLTHKPSLLDIRVIMVTLTGFCVFLNVYATQT